VKNLKKGKTCSRKTLYMYPFWVTILALYLFLDFILLLIFPSFSDLEELGRVILPVIILVIMMIVLLVKELWYWSITIDLNTMQLSTRARLEHYIFDLDSVYELRLTENRAEHYDIIIEIVCENYTQPIYSWSSGYHSQPEYLFQSASKKSD